VGDRGLRGLERSALEGGDEEGREYLRNALRQGTLTSEDLALLVHTGAVAAAQIAGVPPTQLDLRSAQWLGGLAACGRQPLALVAWAAAGVALEHVPADPSAAELLSATKVWLLEGAPEAQVRVSHALADWRQKRPKPVRVLRAVDAMGNAAFLLGPVLATGGVDALREQQAKLSAGGVVSCVVPVGEDAALHLLGRGAKPAAIEAFVQALGCSTRHARNLAVVDRPTLLSAVKEAVFAVLGVEGRQAGIEPGQLESAVVDTLRSAALRHL
jgi:hypothetical protein